MNIYTPLEKGLGDWIRDSVVTSFEDADIVLLPGGSDVNPALYNHEKLSTTFINTKSDDAEMLLLTKARQTKKFIIGICKGSQLLTVAAGGWLIQDIDGHHGHHQIETYDGKSFTVNSSHHQMCYPYDLPDEDYELLGWSSGISSKYITQGNKEILLDLHRDGDIEYEGGYFKEPEIIWYPKIRGLAVQSHPEWASQPTEFNNWLNGLILQLI